MENKINIAELLKDCPKGTKLYSPLCGECRVIKVYNYLGFDVINGTDDVFNFSYDGRYNLMGECCIFPSKDQRDWSKFQRPFIDGDIVVCTNKSCTFTAIFKSMRNDSSFYRYGVMYDNKFRCLVNDWSDFNDSCRLATEEEKKKLFDAIKENGYKWNGETKSLEKLVEPKFKVGDKVRNKNNHNVVFAISSIEEDSYVCGGKMAFCFNDQDDWELVPNKFDSYPMMIPYEGNEHLLSTTTNCKEYYKNW